MMKDYLFVYSMAEFFPVICPILEVIHASAIAELSAKDTENSKYLQFWLSGKQGKLMVLDAESSAEFQQWSTTVSDVVTHIGENSITAIEKLPAMDAWFLHGNPNWFTVYHELCAIYNACRKHRRPMIVFIHDVAWPCARRDWYSIPERIPEKFRQFFSRDFSLARADIKVMEGRAAEFAYALTEGGERNGVLTAVEDFAAHQMNEFYWGVIPSIFGLGILFDKQHPHAPMIANLLAPYHQQPLLANLEKNRIANYLMTYDLKKTQQKAPIIFEIEENLNDAEMAVSINRLLETLGDDADHPEIWNIFKLSAQSDGKESLIALANYMNELLDTSQPPQAVRILTVAHAVCAAYLGNPLFACKKLEELTTYAPESRLAQGALQQVRLLEIATSSPPA